MHESERNRLINEIRRLRLAESDMAQAAMAAHYLSSEHLNGDLCRALETAIAVCYARPFGGRNGVGVQDEEWEPEGAVWLRLHTALLDMRDRVYAHNDRTDARDIIDAGDFFGPEHAGTFLEQWLPLNRDVLPQHVGLFESQQERFRSARDERQRELAAARS